MRRKFLCAREGQSLVEILVGVAVGAMLVASASFAIMYVLRSSRSNQNIQTANLISQDLLDKVRTYSDAEWHNVYSLTKTTASYYIFASSSEFSAAEGREGIFDNDVPNGLIARWGLDEASGTIAYDTSGNNNIANVLNVSVRTTSGCRAGYCVILNGTTACASSSDSSSLDLTNAITLSAFVRATSSPSGSGIISKVSGGLGYELAFATSGIIASFYNSSGVALQPVNAANVQDGNWHHVAATYDGLSAVAYVDGIAGTAVTGSNYLSANDTSLLLGKSSGGIYAYTGIDEARVYNRALTADEVKRLWNATPFSRYFSIQDVCRSNDSSNVIASVKPCTSGNLEDPSTEQVTVIADWVTNTGTSQVTLVDYITRWKNRVFRQSDWSGGTQYESTVLTQPNDKYASSTGADVTSVRGSVKVQGY